MNLESGRYTYRAKIGALPFKAVNADNQMSAARKVRALFAPKTAWVLHLVDDGKSVEYWNFTPDAEVIVP